MKAFIGIVVPSFIYEPIDGKSRSDGVGSRTRSIIGIKSYNVPVTSILLFGKINTNKPLLITGDIT